MDGVFFVSYRNMPTLVVMETKSLIIHLWLPDGDCSDATGPVLHSKLQLRLIFAEL